MGTLEERVAYLEGRGEEHAATIGEVRADIRELRADMNRRFDHMEIRFDTRFMWLIGFQFATFMAVIAALLNGYFR
jgi:hypothetical protein